MDSYKTLYKVQPSYKNPRQYNTINRELQETRRCKQRRERFQDTRNISTSPKKEVDDEKIKKQEAFIKRFTEWKQKKLNMSKNDINKKKPFVVAVNNDKTTYNSLVPKGHHEGFRPPVGVNPINVDKLVENKIADVKARRSTYTIVSTPQTKKKQEICITNKVPKKTGIDAKNASTNFNKSKTAKKLSNKNDEENKNRSIKTTPANKSTAKVDAVNLAKTIEKNKTNTNTNGPRPRVFKIPPPKPPTTTAATLRNNRSGTIAKNKIVTQKNNENVKKTKISPLKRSGARLASNFKAKKPPNLPNINGKMLVNLLKINQPVEDMVIQTPRDFAMFNPYYKFVTSTKIKDSEQAIANYKKISPKKTVQKLSKCKSSAKRNLMQDATDTALVKECDKNLRKTTTEDGLRNAVKKFNFIRYSGAADVVANNHKNNTDKIMQIEKKENDKNDTATTPTKCGPEERPANYLSPFVSVTRGKVSLKKEKENRNSVYLQCAAESNDLPTAENTSQIVLPTYSVETLRTLEAVRYFRKQLQDEIDRLHKLCDVWEVYKKENLEKIQNANGEDMVNATIGQTRLLTSRKFMQFKGLIDRCEAGATGIGAVEYDGNENTKPITSIDLEGFWSMLGLQIDNVEKRFENLNRWKSNNWVDPDEEKAEIKKNLMRVKKAKAASVAKAKPNPALKQMLRKMQAEMLKNKNKQNDDIILTPSKSHQRRLENKNISQNSADTSSSSRRISITVKDRKYFSPAATVITVSSPKYHNTNKLRSSENSPKFLQHLKKFHESLDNLQSPLCLRKTVLLNENSKHSPIIIDNKSNDHENSFVSLKENNKENDFFVEQTSSSQSPWRSPLPTTRKSILKTPGTAKSRLRNVIFNEKLRVKKFNFLINEDGKPFDAENSNISHEEDLAKSCEEELQTEGSQQRVLNLRNRKVRLRPSSEISIPK